MLTAYPQKVKRTRPGPPEARPVTEAGIATLEDANLLEQPTPEAGDLERCMAWA